MAWADGLGNFPRARLSLRPMRTATPLAGLATLLLAAGANADTFSATRSDKLVEKAHTVEIMLRQDHALIEVERTVYNGGERPDQALFHVFTASEMAAVGLRTQAIVDGRAVWFEGELMEAEAAAAKYRELTGLGGYYPKDPALLSWRSQGHLALQVFPCMPKQEKHVAYTLLAPMRYEAGKYVLDLPEMGTEDVVPKAVVVTGRSKATLDGADLPGQFELDEAHRIEQRPSFFGPVGGRLASVPFATKSVLTGFHLDVAPKLSTVPDHARVVVLVDTSRSMSDGERSASLLAASAYLDHFTGDRARASVLAFHRKVDALTDGFATIAKAKGALAGAKLSGKNGSEVAVALKRAGEMLSQAPDGAARRVVLFTDLKTKEALTPEVVKKALPKGAVLHVVTASSGSPSLSRDDDDPWAVLPRATGGLLWRASADDSSAAEDMKATFEELARPLRLDMVSVRAPGLDEEISNLTLAEGDGIERQLIASEPMSKVTLEAELWSERVKKTLAPDAEYGRLRAALVFGTDMLGSLSEEQMMTLAKHGRAVSPVTSYLAIEPGVRPSTEGLEDGEGQGGGSRGEGIGLGSIGTIGRGAGGSSPPDYEALLADALVPAKKACGVMTASVAAESTVDEIVELAVTVEDASETASKQRCLLERAWEVELPSDFARVAHRITKVRI